MSNDETDWDEPRREEVEAVVSDPLVEPSPPSTIPPTVVEMLEDHSPDTLRHVAEYALQLTLHMETKEEYERKQRVESNKGKRISDPPEDWEEEEWEEKLEQKREAMDGDIPGKANRVTKTIDGRDYIYAQWREGDTVKRQYIAPVVPANSEN